MGRRSNLLDEEVHSTTNACLWYDKYLVAFNDDTSKKN